MSASGNAGSSGNERLLAEFVDVVRRRWRWIVAVLVATLAIAAVDVARTTPMYRSTTTITVKPIVGTGGQGAVGTVAEQVELLEGSRIRDGVLERIGPPATGSFDAGPDGTLSIRISGESEDPARAALIATTYAEVFAEVLMELDLDQVDRVAEVVREQFADAERQLDAAYASGVTDDIPELDSRRRAYFDQLGDLDDQRGFIEQGRINVLETADTPGSPYDPRPRRAATNALAIGLIVGLFAAFVRDYFDDRLDTLDAIERHIGELPILGTIPVFADDSPTITAVLDNPGDRSPVTEAYRSTRTSLKFIQAGADRRVIQITSPTKGDGKSTSVAHLAISLARADQHVLLIDLDLRSPVQHKLFDLDNATGFTSLLLGDTTVEAVIHNVPAVPGLSILTSGPLPPDPSELLAGRRSSTTLTDLASRFDVVLIDSPPVLPVSDPSVIAAHANGTVLAVRAGTTRRGQITDTITQLQRAGATLLGVIIVGLDDRRQKYGYGYGYGEPFDPTSRQSVAPPAHVDSTASTNGDNDISPPL